MDADTEIRKLMFSLRWQDQAVASSAMMLIKRVLLANRERTGRRLEGKGGQEEEEKKRGRSYLCNHVSAAGVLLEKGGFGVQ